MKKGIVHDVDFFDLYLHYKGKKQEKVFFVNLGAMDGILFDELHGYSSMYNFKGLYIEPIPYLFEKLKQNIDSNNLFENCAVSDYNGEIEMIMIDQNAIDEGKVHNCFYGMSAVYPPQNGLGSEGDRETVEKYGKKITVPCKTFDTIADQYKIEDVQLLKIDAEGHDYQIFNTIDLKKYNIDCIRLEYINLTKKEQENIRAKLDSNNYLYSIVHQDIVALKESIYKQMSSNSQKHKITLVTGLWDIGRGEMNTSFERTYEHYLECFSRLLKLDINIIVFGDKTLKKFVDDLNVENVQFIDRELSWFKNEFYDKIQEIRTNDKWSKQVGWLSDSPQGKLEWYNPIVMSKMMLLHDAKILDSFDSEYLYWIDAGLSNTVSLETYVTQETLTKISNKINKFLFLAFPFKANTEIHGFEYPKINEYANGKEINLVGRGGFFGGKKDSISEVFGNYYQLLKTTLNDNYMGTEESLFSIMIKLLPGLVSYFELEENGLVYRLFQDTLDDNLKITQTKAKFKSISKIGLYVITFNSPKQFEKLVKSIELYDRTILTGEKYLLNNSTDESTTEGYNKLCKKYNFTHIQPGKNIGICGGRQYIAEHFDKTKLDGYFFFEDDMFFYNGEDEFCKNGFRRKIKNFLDKITNIVNLEEFDFLKLNFTEFFGDNSRQWAWYNIPEAKRDELFSPGVQKPFTKYENIKSYNKLAYATGEIYYCNWPQLVTREGNKKLFLEVVWEYPYEQTWMSYIYQKTLEGYIKPGILLATPTEHDRFEHYDKELRREN